MKKIILILILAFGFVSQSFADPFAPSDVSGSLMLTSPSVTYQFAPWDPANSVPDYYKALYTFSIAPTDSGVTITPCATAYGSPINFRNFWLASATCDPTANTTTFEFMKEADPFSSPDEITFVSWSICAWDAETGNYLYCYFSDIDIFPVSPSTWPTPQPITWYFSSPVEVSSWSYNWNMVLNLSQSGHIDDVQSIQLWDAFRVVSTTSSENHITLAIEPTSVPLAVACTSYTVTIPWGLIQGNDGASANQDSITGSFSVTGCPVIDDTGSTNTGYTTTYGSGLSQSGSFIALVQKDEAWNTFVNLASLTYLIGFISFFLSVFYGLYSFIKTSFLWKK